MTTGSQMPLPPLMAAGKARASFIRSSEGAAAIEFALLAIPYFMIVFAILETFIAFAGEQLVASAVDTLGRRIRTGQITYNMNRSTDMTQAAFRQAVCDEVKILITCSSTEVATPNKLWVDVRSFSSFAAIPVKVPRVSSAAFADLDTTQMQYAPGGAGTINMVRVYYRWQIITDIVRPYISTVRPAGSTMGGDFLIVGTAAFQNEQYP